MKNSRFLTIFFIVFVDLLGFSLILPLLPYYAESFGATPVMVGLLVASYAALLMGWVVSFAYRRMIIPARRARLEVEAEGSQA